MCCYIHCTKTKMVFDSAIQYEKIVLLPDVYLTGLHSSSQMKPYPQLNWCVFLLRDVAVIIVITSGDLEYPHCSYLHIYYLYMYCQIAISDNHMKSFFSHFCVNMNVPIILPLPNLRTNLDIFSMYLFFV